MTDEPKPSRAKVLLGILLDPPPWLPAWAITAVVLTIGWRATTSPEAMPALTTLADLLVKTLAIWLGYRGVRYLPDLLAALRGRDREPKEPPQ